MLLILIALGVLLLALMFYFNRKRRWAKHKAESRLDEFRHLLSVRGKTLHKLSNQVEFIEHSTLHTCGATEKLATEALKAGQKLEERFATTTSAIEKAESLINPEDNEAKLKNFFFADGYLDAIYVLDEESAKLPSEQECIETGDFIAFNAKQITDSFESLNHLSRFAASDLEKSARRVSQLVNQSYGDGFFPLINLRTKLIPSLETMLDETNRVGAKDPITAVENPAKLASQQLKNLKLIIDTVDQIRKTICPTIESAATKIEKASQFPDWVNHDFLKFSRKIESISNHATLWSIDDRIDNLQNEVDGTTRRILEIDHLSEQLTGNTEPELDRLDTLISRARWEIAQSIHPKPDQILREGNLDPSRKVELARHTLALVKNSASLGQGRNLDSDLVDIQQLINEGYEILRIGKNVVAHGEHYWRLISRRATSLTKKLDTAQRQIQSLELDYHPDVLPYQSKTGAVSINDVTSQLIPECQSELHAAQVSYRKGNLLTTGSQLERAASRLEIAETYLSSIDQRYSEAETIAKSNRKLVGDVRWRHRTLLAKVDDHCTRHTTIEYHKKLQQAVQAIEADLAAPTNDPFVIDESLNRCLTDLQRLEDDISVDKLWHELATESIKSAARTLRAHRSVLEVLSGETGTNQRRLNAANNSIEDLKERLTRWQDFLEQPHQDWREAFDGGIAIETESSEAVHAIREDTKQSREASVHIRKAGQQITYLMNWPNNQNIEVERQAGISNLDEARSAFAHGKIDSALNLARIASERAEAALTIATARSKRLKSHSILQQNQTTHDAVTPTFDLSRKIAKLMVSPLTANWTFDGQFGFPKSTETVELPPESVASVLSDTSRQTLPIKYSNQRDRDPIPAKVAHH